jgi:hypothetical protein
LLEGGGSPDPELRADLLLAGLAAEQVRHWIREEHRNLADIAAGLSAAALALSGAK